MGFVVYEKGSAPIASVPSVTVQKRGLLSINRAAFALMKEPAAVELLWDPDRTIIGLRPVPIEEPNAYPVRAQVADSKRGPLLIAGNLFTKFIGLNTDEAHRWTPYMDEGILCLNVGKPGAKVNSNRGAKKAADAAT